MARLFAVGCLLALVCGCRPHAASTDAGSTPGEDAAAVLDAGTVDRPDADRGDASLPAYPSIASLLPGPGDATLFVGNSYTFVNDLPTEYRALETARARDPLRIESVTAGGYTLAQHAADMLTPGSALSTFLVTGTVDDRRWDVVVLQEQSQIPGFPPGQPELQASLDAASSIAAHAGNDAIIVYATWGREHGDDLNPGLYPDFLTMESLLEAGFRAMRDRLSAEGHTVRIAPVGAAFARVYASVVAAGDDPTAVGSAFDALYAADGSHPSPLGTYLATCVMLGTITGTDPVTFADDATLGLSAEQSWSMRLVARATLMDPAWTP